MPPKTAAALLAGVLALAGAAHSPARVSGALQAGAGPLAVIGLEVNGSPEPLGVGDQAPRLTWRLDSDRRGVMQSGVRVLVASRADLLGVGAADVWDSGDLAGADPSVLFAGPRLQSRTRYYWRVQVTAPPHPAPVWSAPSWFETGLLVASDWRARWIAGPERAGVLTAAEGAADDEAIRAAGEFCRPVGWLTTGFAARRFSNDQGECRELRPAPLLRKAFTLARRVEAARVYTSGLAYNHLTINGERVARSVLDPAFTDYSRTTSCSGSCRPITTSPGARAGRCGRRGSPTRAFSTCR